MSNEKPPGGMGSTEYTVWSGCGTVIFVVFLLAMLVSQCS